MKLAPQTKKLLTILLHSIVWIVVFSLPYLLKPSYNEPRKLQPPHDPRYDYHYIINCFTFVALFYLNAYFLITQFFIKRKYWQYFLLILVVISLFSVISEVSFNSLFPEKSFQIQGLIFFYIFPCIFIIASSTAFSLFKDRASQDKLLSERENENLKTELSFLRSQVSPHFMFNVLNNMVALARKKSELLEPSLIKLSSLLRYMLYETDDEKVPLEKEVEYLQSYIDLQQQRFGKNVQINASLKNIDGNYSIAPMLLIPFVENAFKHGTGLVAGSFINVHLAALHNELSFTVINKYDIQTKEVKDKTSGIGLNNVTRRLNLLYPENHTLLITKKDDEFVVSLQLKLN